MQFLDSVVFRVNSRFTGRTGVSTATGRPRRTGYSGQAGCRPGPDGIYMHAGERLSLRAVTTAGVEARELQLRLVQAQLA